MSNIRPGDILELEPPPKRRRSSDPSSEGGHEQFTTAHDSRVQTPKRGSATLLLSTTQTVKCDHIAMNSTKDTIEDPEADRNSPDPLPDEDSRGTGERGVGLIPHYQSGSAQFEGVLNEEFDDAGKSELPGLVPHYGSGDVEASNSAMEDSSGQVFSLLADYEDDDEEMEEQPPVTAQNVKIQPNLNNDISNPSKSEAQDLHNRNPPADVGGEAIKQGSPEENPADLPPHLMVGSAASPKAQQAAGEKEETQIQEDGGNLLECADETASDGVEEEEGSGGSAHSGGASDIQSPAESDVCTEDLDSTLPEEYRQPPIGEVSSGVQETVKSLLEVQLKQNIFFNEEILVNKQFRNPCFLTKMANHFGINEFGTLLSPDIYDPENLPKEDMPEGLRAERQRRASTSHLSSNPGAGGRVVAPLSAPPGVQNAILQGQRRLREKFTVMAGGKTRPTKWDSGR